MGGDVELGWLVLCFIDADADADADAEFLDVPAVDVLATAAATGAAPYDVPGGGVSHVGELCSFDAFLLKCPLIKPALDRLATIVRGANTARLDLWRRNRPGRRRSCSGCRGCSPATTRCCGTAW